MRIKGKNFVLIGFFTLLVLLMGSSGVLAYPATGYYAALNSLPEAQGWTFYDDGSNTPYVAGGTLYQGPTSLGGGQRWQTYGSGGYDFTSTEKFIMEAELKVVNSTYDPSIGGSGLWRAGYYLSAYDDATRWIGFGITSDGIRVSRGPELEDSNSTPFISFDTTAAFNTYRAEIANGQMEIFINSISKGTLAVGGPIGSVSDKNAVWFGDGSGWALSQTELHYVSFGDVGTPVPLPGAILLLAPGLAGLAAIRRKMIR